MEGNIVYLNILNKQRTAIILKLQEKQIRSGQEAERTGDM